MSNLKSALVSVTPDTVNASPVSVFREQKASLDAYKETPTQEIDRQLNAQSHSVRAGFVRTIRTAPWSRGRWFYTANEDASTGTYQRQLRPKTRPKRRQAFERLERKLEELIAEGWEIVCFRVPISENLEVVESEAFNGELFHRMCERIDVPYFDYTRGVEMETTDGSHLTAPAGRTLTRQLARDIKTKTDWARPR